MPELIAMLDCFVSGELFANARSPVLPAATDGFLDKTRTWDCFRPSHSGYEIPGHASRYFGVSIYSDPAAVFETLNSLAVCRSPDDRAQHGLRVSSSDVSLLTTASQARQRSIDLQLDFNSA
jgi:hypothetical protein